MATAAARRAAANRKRIQRRRERAGLVPLAIEVHEERFLRVLVQSGRMSDEAALRADLVEREAACRLLAPNGTFRG